jgi:hypothetical protein
MRSAPNEDVFRSANIGLLVRSPLHGDAGKRSRMNHRVNAGAGGDYGVAVGNVAADDFDAKRRELWILAAAETANAIAARNELLDDVSPKEPAAASD